MDKCCKKITMHCPIVGIIIADLKLPLLNRFQHEMYIYFSYIIAASATLFFSCRAFLHRFQLYYSNIAGAIRTPNRTKWLMFNTYIAVASALIYTFLKLFWPVLSIIFFPKPVTVFPGNHKKKKKNGQRWQMNESCHSDYRQSSEGILVEPGIEPATSQSQFFYATNWSMGRGTLKRLQKASVRSDFAVSQGWPGLNFINLVIILYIKGWVHRMNDLIVNPLLQ